MPPSSVIRRGTRRYRALLERATSVTVFRYDDNFAGKRVSPSAVREAVQRYPAMRRRLIRDEGYRGQYVLTMSNSWWFTFKDPICYCYSGPAIRLSGSSPLCDFCAGVKIS